MSVAPTTESNARKLGRVTAGGLLSLISRNCCSPTDMKLLPVWKAARRSAWKVCFDANQFHYKRLQLRGIHSLPNRRFPMAIDLLARRVIDGRQFVSQTFALEKAQEALSTAAFDKEQALKVMVVMEG
jgi:threonine dehydrogenase-like Zn-dependent dehydrogenase